MQATAGRDGEKSSLSAMRKGSIEHNNMQSRKLGLTHLKAQTHTHKQTTTTVGESISI